MVDITKCKAENCPVKEKCYRYTSKSGELQSYFLDVPFKIKNNKFSCDMYLRKSLLDDLTSIFE